MGIIKRIITFFSIFTLTFGMISCGSNVANTEQNNSFDGRVFYEIFVRAFNDTNNDGIGDLNGVTQKLDYIKDLGVGGIWLMPINSSPSYHGYDVTDYKEINSEYGTLEDFKTLIKEAHKRDIKVYIDMVINHTSSEHEWFKKASSILIILKIIISGQMMIKKQKKIHQWVQNLGRKQREIMSIIMVYFGVECLI